MTPKNSAAMEMPLHHLVRATELFQDFICATSEDRPPRWAGLMFLAHALNREALILKSLYYDEAPDDD